MVRDRKGRRSRPTGTGVEYRLEEVKGCILKEDEEDSWGSGLKESLDEVFAEGCPLPDITES